MLVTQTASGIIVTATIDYSQSFEVRIGEGYYCYVSKDVVENLATSIQGVGVVEVTIELIDLERNYAAEDADEVLAERKLPPILIEHLLAIGAQYSDLQYHKPILCSGSLWGDDEGDLEIAYLDGWSNWQRRVRKGRYDIPLAEYCCVGGIIDSHAL